MRKAPFTFSALLQYWDSKRKTKVPLGVPRVTRFLEHGPGLVDAVFRSRQVGIMPELMQGRYGRIACLDSPAKIVYERPPVKSVVNGLPEVNIVEGLLVQVGTHLVNPVARRAADLKKRKFPETIGKSRSKGVLGDVDFTPLQSAGYAILARDGPKVKIIQRGRGKMILVPLEIDLLTLAPVPEFEGTASDGIGIQVFTGILEPY